jgi:uncharacterized protein DUF2568
MGDLTATPPEGQRGLRLAPQQLLLLVLRSVMEMGIVAGLAYWGVAVGDGAGMKVVAGLGAPAVAFGFWGAVDFRRAGRAAEPLRLIQELLVSGLAAAALIAAGQPALGWALAALSVAYHAGVYVSGATLLGPTRDATH